MPKVAPPLGLYLSELPRAIGELAAFAITRPWLAALPAGDGHEVLVLPGLQADDDSTRLLRGVLKAWGYSAHGWGLGRNIGPTSRVLDGLEKKVDQLAAHQDRPISIIGWSLGGIYAREVARRAPESVRQVITLGTPFAMDDPKQSNAYSLYESYAHLHVERHRLPLAAESAPLPVPTSSIYSRCDGIVAWETCLNFDAPCSENILIRGSHCGLGHNPAAVFAIADRLRQPVDGWRPFSAPARLRQEFPAAQHRSAQAA